ncbi:urease accessory protein UreF [Nakamurella flava]|uniref:Urease accessory protein UreF n=2 Tax=Nakamurella flava TaxID=2576308 RepID=A0A4U6QAZ9_9ACTN|nr:urease accessory protein UreF [Nakamurella flava]
MLLGDARLPTGAHTQSAGLEPALRAGMTVDDIPSYLTARLRSVVPVEAGAAVLARREVLDATAPDDLTARLTAVDEAWRARTVSPALRDNAQVLGRGYLRLLRGLWPDDLGVRALTHVGKPSRGVVLGVAGAAAGLSAAQVARLVGYDDAQTVAAAALKLEPMDPTRAARWVFEAAPDIENLSSLAGLATVDDLPATTAPLVEEWAERHAVAGQRLFRA